MNTVQNELKQEVRSFPSKPGVYIMKDTNKNILYIGKANNLRKRVTSYFAKNTSIKTKFLIDKVAYIEHVVTKHEYEALLLENNLIKQWTPHYNINLKDGKTYPVIRITNEDFPRVFRTRRVINDGSLYFGPYTDINSIDLYLELIEKLFKIRRCKGRLKPRSNPCLYYHMHMCDAPCCGYIGREEYGQMIEEVKRLLSGDSRHLQYDLEQKMETAAENLEYEQAATYRDSLQAVETSRQKQEVVDYIEEERDYIALAVEGTLYTFGVFQMRGGKLSGQDIIRTETLENEGEAFEHFLLQYYTPEHLPPQRIYISLPVRQEEIQHFFKEEYGRSVIIDVPETGRHFSLLKMAGENARIDMMHRLENKENNLEQKAEEGMDLLNKTYEIIYNEEDLDKADELLAKGLKSNGPFYALGEYLSKFLVETKGESYLGEILEKGVGSFFVEGLKNKDNFVFSEGSDWLLKLISSKHI